jgi:predicted PolB exonuclease-like 3'-5' exonuclease
VSWNGGGFDLPVLNYRALINGVAAPKFWDQGEDDKDFRWNSYLGRYHARHLDLMDVLAMYQPRNNAPLDDVARLAGFPGKVGVGGAQVWSAWQAGKVAEIRNYCEADTANTYLLYLRFQELRGVLTAAQYRKECGLLREVLEKRPEPHWREFLSLWKT